MQTERLNLCVCEREREESGGMLSSSSTPPRPRSRTRGGNGTPLARSHTGGKPPPSPSPPPSSQHARREWVCAGRVTREKKCVERERGGSQPSFPFHSFPSPSPLSSPFLHSHGPALHHHLRLLVLAAAGDPVHPAAHDHGAPHGSSASALDTKRWLSGAQSGPIAAGPPPPALQLGST